MANFDASAKGQYRGIVSPYGIDDPDLSRQLFQKYPRMDTLSMLRSTGRIADRTGQVGMRTTSQHKFEFYEETNWLQAVTGVQAKVTAFGGATGLSNSASVVYIQLPAADHATDSGGTFPKKGYTGIVSGTGEHVYVQEVDRSTAGQHKLKLIRTDAGDDLDTAITTSSKIFWFSNANVEASGPTESMVPAWEKFTDYLQTFRCDYKVSDHEEFVEKWITLPNGDNALKIQGLENAAELFAYQEEAAFIFGKYYAGVTLEDGETNMGTVQTTNGIINTAETYGIDAQNSTNSVDDFETLVLAMENAYADDTYVFECGLKRINRLNKWAGEFQKLYDSTVDFSVIGGKEQAISMNLQSFHFSGYDFLFRKSKMFSHPDSAGADGFDYNDMMLGMPMGSAPIRIGASRETAPMIQIAYVNPMGSAEENRGHYRVFEYGGNSRKGATDGTLTRSVAHVSYKGLETHCKHKFIKVYGDTPT